MLLPGLPFTNEQLFFIGYAQVDQLKTCNMRVLKMVNYSLDVYIFRSIVV